MFLTDSVEKVLTDRIKALEGKAQDYALQSEAGKLLPAMLTVGGVCASIVNPTAPLFALIGFAGYTASVMLDHHNTGRLTPIPCKRSSLRELREEMLSDEPSVKSLFDTTIDSLSPGDRQEYFVLVRGFQYLAQMLSQVPVEYRESLYEKAWRNPTHYLPQVPTVEVIEAEEPAALPPGNVTVNNEVNVSPTIAAPVVNVSVPNPSPVIIPMPQRSSEAKKEQLPVIDLTENLAAEHNILISAKRDSGKTTTVKAAIRHRYEQTGGNCIFWIADPKGSQFLGLEKSPSHYLFVDDRNITHLLGMLEAAHVELKRRIDVRRETGNPTMDPVLTILLDEWLALLTYCQEDKELHKRVRQLATIIAVQGREDKVNIWISTHSHLVQDCGFASTVRDSFAVYALGRKAPGKAAAMESIQAAISDQYLMRDQEMKSRFLGDLREHPPSHAPVIFTPTDGGVLCQLPDLSEFVNWEYPLTCTAPPNEV